MSGSYRVMVSPHTYDNPTGRCDKCQPGPYPGCCDEPTVRPADQQCPTSLTCDPVFSYRYCDIGNNCEGVQSALFLSDSNSVVFDPDIAGPVILEKNEPWNVSDF